MRSNQFANLRAVLDSGATNSAAWHAWVRTFYARKSRPKMNPSSKVFRFGDSMAFQSIGTMTVVLPVRAVEKGNLVTTLLLSVEIDIIQARIPLLVSQRSLCKLGCSINFADSTMLIPPAIIIQLGQPVKGHISSPIVTQFDDSSTTICRTMIVGQLPVPQSMSDVEIRRLRLNLPHASVGSMHRIILAAKRVVDKERLSSIVAACPMRSTKCPHPAGDDKRVLTGVLRPRGCFGHILPGVSGFPTKALCGICLRTHEICGGPAAQVDIAVVYRCVISVILDSVLRAMPCVLVGQRPWICGESMGALCRCIWIYPHHNANTRLTQ